MPLNGLRLWRLFVFAAMAGCSADALPCTVTRIDTPDELVDQAEVIVRARVVGQAVGATSTSYGAVTFQVLERLKGKAPSGTFSVLGYTDRYEGPNSGEPPYRHVRRGGQHGNCFAHDYKPDAEFLLFLRNGTPYWSALAPVNEEVTGADDPWVVWVKARIATTP